MLILLPLAQGEDASGGVSCERPPRVLSAGATQQHVKATGAGRLSAALRQAVSVAGQLGQQQRQDEHQDFLLGEREEFKVWEN